MPTIYTNHDYQEVLGLFSRHALDKSLTVNAIKTTVLPRISQNDSFLDVGAGPGKITDSIRPYFKKVVVIEPFIEYAESLEKRLYTVFPCEFQRASLNEYFNFILCCQVLYHVDILEWPYFISKIRELLVKDGMAMVVLGASRGTYYEFCIRLNPDYRTSEVLISYLKARKIDFFVEKKQAYYRTDSLDVMYTLCRFSVLEGCLTSKIYSSLSLEERDAIDMKIMTYAKQLKTNSDYYELYFERDFIYFKRD